MKYLLLLLLMTLGGISGNQAFPPYYDIADAEAAKSEALQRHLPLAWLGVYPEDLKTPDLSTTPSTSNDNSADLTQMALNDLQGQTVVICFDGRNMGPVPAIVHAQDHILDDGPLSNANWLPPKVVFTNPQVTRVLGRVSHTQMKADRETPINLIIQTIAQDPTSLAPDAAPPSANVSYSTPISAGATTSTPNATDQVRSQIASLLSDINDDADDMSPDEVEVWNWCKHNAIYVGLGVAVVLLFLRAASRPPSK